MWGKKLERHGEPAHAGLCQLPHRFLWEVNEVLLVKRCGTEPGTQFQGLAVMESGRTGNLYEKTKTENIHGKYSETEERKFT